MKVNASTGRGSGANVDAVRAEVCALHAELVASGLVAWTSGNVSARVPGTDLLVIKPSGVSYAELTPESMVVCDLDGRPLAGQRLSPSSDTASHAYIYRHLRGVGGVGGVVRVSSVGGVSGAGGAGGAGGVGGVSGVGGVGGVVHTHSPYATAWAARGEAIPCVLTAMADEFGGEIPCGPFAPIGGDEIGRAVVATLAGHRSPAVLLRSHGVFTIGATPREAVQAAVMCEDAARTVHLARAFGAPDPLPPDQVDALHRRYKEVYGQR